MRNQIHSYTIFVFDPCVYNVTMRCVWNWVSVLLTNEHGVIYTDTNLNKASLCLDLFHAVTVFCVSVSLRFTPMDRSPRKGLWDDPVECVQHKRGKTCHSMSSRNSLENLPQSRDQTSRFVSDLFSSFSWPMTCTSLPSLERGWRSWLWWVCVYVCRTEHNHSVSSWRHSRRCGGILLLHLLKGWLSFIVLKCLGWLWEQLILLLEGVFSTVKMSWPHLLICLTFEILLCFF